MKPFLRCSWRLLRLALVAVVAACAVNPGAPTIRLEKVVREVPGADPRWQQVESAEGVRVWRAEREVAVRGGMLLYAGDVVETGPDVAAVLDFRASGSVVLDEATRVRIGSLEVFFGRVFANVRGFFETSSDAVVAGVSGTRFLFDVRRDRTTRVTVAEGEVTCSPRAGGWAPVRLFPNQALAVPLRGQPQRIPADPRDLRDAIEWAERVVKAPAPGWCCVGGRTVPGWSDRCGAAFSTQHAVTEAQCRPPPPEPRGWCCSAGRVSETTRGECRGSFHGSLAEARYACAIK